MPTVTLNRVQSGVGALTFEAVASAEVGDLRLGCAYQLRSGLSSTVQQKGKKAVRKREVREEGDGEVDLNEDQDESVGGGGEEEEGSDGFGDEGVDLATMLDGDGGSDGGM